MNHRQQDIDLLRRHEPVIRYTRGETFFPMDVEPYVARCSLWIQPPGRPAQCLVPPGRLTLEGLAQPRPAEFDSVFYLKIAEPLTAAKLASYALKQRRQPKDPMEVFDPGRGRLARVGYASRFVDALFSLSLLARGRVPGDAAAAAHLIYREIRQEHPEFHYHGRVIRQDGWIVLQYWFFYLFNNWRSGFFGANDHEADWEMVCIYLAEDGSQEPRPEWIALASHDYQGDDLRRRWDDPEVEKQGSHPVIYAGAGSHASYFQPGEYLTELELPFLRPLAQVWERLDRFWHENLRQYGGQGGSPGHRHGNNVFRVPFVDYARGDGVAVGPGQTQEWGPLRLLEPPPPWVSQYRGLWGLFTQDPFSGEDAPAGPMYNRDGSVRRAWHDPVGWAGLDKVPPHPQALVQLQRRQEAIRERLRSQQEQVSQKLEELRGLGVESEAMRAKPYLSQLFRQRQEAMEALSQEIAQLRAQISVDETLLASLDEYAQRLQAGELGSMRGHIDQAHTPAPGDAPGVGRLAEIWAALSVGLTLLGFVGLVLFAPQYLIFGLVLIVALFVFIEATFRGTLGGLITNVTIGLAILAALVLAYEFFWPIVIAGVLAAGSYILWENLRELWR